VAELYGNLIGDGDAMQSLQMFEEAMQKKILANALSKNADRLASAVEIGIAMAGVGEKTGNLKRVLGKHVKRYTHNVYAAVGPLWAGGQHGHLVEFGHRIATGGTIQPLAMKRTAPMSKSGKRGGGTVKGMTRAFHFEGRTWNAMADVILGGIEHDIAQGVAAELHG
jgi:hypothetical protein